MVLLEGCVDSVASALAAEAGGAERLELCDNLLQGGTTPSIGMIETVVERVRIPVCVIVRSRGGDFVYDDDEMKIMSRDAAMMRSLGAAGIVIGPLTGTGEIDADRTSRLVDAAGGLTVAFHRAFDETADKRRSLDELVELGVSRVLTSGGPATAREGMLSLAALVRHGGDDIAIIAGGKVRGDHVARLVERTGVREVHARIRTIDDAASIRAALTRGP